MSKTTNFELTFNKVHDDYNLKVDTCYEEYTLLLSKEELLELKELINDFFEELEYDGPYCSDCHFAYFRETGYSNYTVEGCDIGCSLKKNHKFPVDKYYNEDIPGNDFAGKCSEFKTGTPSKYDVGDGCPFE